MDGLGCFGVSPSPMKKVENKMDLGCFGVSPSPMNGLGCFGVSPSPSMIALENKMELGCIGVSPSPLMNALEYKMELGCLGVSPAPREETPRLDDEPERTVPSGSLSLSALAASLI